MPASTTPDGIVYPLSTDPIAPLNTHFEDLADSVQDAFAARWNETTWIAPTLTNSWVVSGGQTVGYRRVGKTVRIRGRVSGGTTGSAFTLPVGFRPEQEISFFVRNGTGGTSCLVRVATDGTVNIVAGDVPNFGPCGWFIA